MNNNKAKEAIVYIIILVVTLAILYIPTYVHKEIYLYGQESITFNTNLKVFLLKESIYKMISLIIPCVWLYIVEKKFPLISIGMLILIIVAIAWPIFLCYNYTVGYNMITFNYCYCSEAIIIAFIIIKGIEFGKSKLK